MKKKLINIIAGSGLALLSINLINKYIFYKSTIKDKLFEPKSRYYSWRYGNIHYTVTGKGKPILLIHGIGCGYSGHVWNENIKELSTNHTVYNIDLLGFGRSDKPKQTYTAYLYVQLINDFIRNVIKQPTDVIADSISCAFITMCCKQNNELFKKLLFINPLNLRRLKKYPRKFSSITRKILESPLLGTSIYNLISSLHGNRKYLTKYAFYNKNKVSNKFVSQFYESSHLGGNSAKFSLSSYLTNYMNIDIRNSLSSIDNSIYIVWGKDSELFDEKVVEQYIEVNPSIEYSIIKNSKLLPYIENKNDFNNICSIFFN